MAKKQNKKQVQEQETAIMRWLKRIFSIQTVSVIAALVAAYYAYKSYIDNQPSQISLEYNVFHETINADDKQNFINLMAANYRSLAFGSGYSDGFIPNGMPNIINKTNKSIKNFKLEVTIRFFHLAFRQEDINKDFEVIENDTTFSTLKLKYKYDVFNAQSAIPIPLKFMHLPESEPFSDDNTYTILFSYNITYDGISEPRDFGISYIVYFDNEEHLSITDKHIDEFLSSCYKQGCFTEYKNNTLVSVVDAARTRVATPSISLTDDSFEKYKERFIKSRDGIKNNAVVR